MGTLVDSNVVAHNARYFPHDAVLALLELQVHDMTHVH
jgi:hypothetical protein